MANDLIPFVPDYTNLEFELLLAKRGLAAAIEQSQNMLADIQGELNKFTVEMDSIFKSEAAFLNKVRQDLLQKQLERRESGVELDLDEAMKNAEFRSRLEQNRQHNANLSKKKVKRKSAGVVRLYRKIAARTHSDKTKDKMLIQLFTIAREAYDLNNYARLEKVWFCISRNMTWNVVLLEEEVKKLQYDHNNVNNTLQEVINSEPFAMLRDYRSKIPFLVDRSKQGYLQMVRKQIGEIVQKLRVLDPVNYPPPPPVFEVKFTVLTSKMTFTKL